MLRIAVIQNALCAAVIAIGCSSLLEPLPALASDGGSGQPLVILCHDTSRDIVQRKLASECNGRIVSPDEAAKIRERRANAIRRALNPTLNGMPGRRLVGIGTGFFVAPSGKVLTNYHVIEGCESISVTTTTGRMVAATLIGADSENDLAVLGASISAPATAVFRADTTRAVNEPIALVGYPNQGIAPIKPLMTPGIVLNMPRDETPIFRIYADVRRGNSGGPVIDIHGQVVGVVFAKVDTVKVYERTGNVVRHVGVAIRNDTVLAFLDRHEIDYARSQAAHTLSEPELLDAARPFIARVGCWR